MTGKNCYKPTTKAKNDVSRVVGSRTSARFVIVRRVFHKVKVSVWVELHGLLINVVIVTHEPSSVVTICDDFI